MSFLEMIGFLWISICTTLSTVALTYFAYLGLITSWRERGRGRAEEFIDRQVEAVSNQLLRRGNRE